MTTTMTREVLTEEMLARFGERAARYDRENRFFAEDFEELRQSGYLTMVIPEDLGGRGYSLAEVCRQQRRLAYRAPATALATNMHLYWTGVAAGMRAMGDNSLEWLLREAAAGEVFAAGHGETGNDRLYGNTQIDVAALQTTYTEIFDRSTWKWQTDAFGNEHRQIGCYRPDGSSGVATDVWFRRQSRRGPIRSQGACLLAASHPIGVQADSGRVQG